METLITLAILFFAGLGGPAADGRVLPTDAQPSQLVYAGVDFFSGEVSEISSGTIDVVRSALGKNDQRRFSINDETKFEGRARRGSRVTVGYYAKSPDVAVTVIVRDGE